MQFLKDGIIYFLAYVFAVRLAQIVFGPKFQELIVLIFFGIFALVLFDAAIGFRSNAYQADGPRVGSRYRPRDRPRDGPNDRPRDEPRAGPRNTPRYEPRNQRRENRRDTRDETWMWTKLNAYKDKTGISTQEMMSIWKRSRDEKSDHVMPKFRYAMSKSMPNGNINPVIFDRRIYNENMECHNGVILIMQPGYYTFTVQARNGANWPKGCELAIYILIENRTVSLAKR